MVYRQEQTGEIDHIEDTNILLDRDGKIIDKDMQRPSNEYTCSIIDALEGIR